MLAATSSQVNRPHTFQGLNSLALSSLLPDAPKNRRQKLSNMRLDFFVGVASHEYVRVGIQAVGAALGAAALEVRDLLNAYIELRLPLVFGNIDIFAVEDFVDRVGTV